MFRRILHHRTTVIAQNCLLIVMQLYWLQSMIYSICGCYMCYLQLLGKYVAV